MAKKKVHIGFELHEDRPADKKIMGILSNLPQHENKCSFIRKAIIFYSENKDKSFDGNISSEKIDELIDKIDSLITVRGELGGEVVSEREEPSHPAPEPKEEISEKAEKPSESTDEEEGEDLKVNADADIDYDSFEDALGDFLG